MTQPADTLSRPWEDVIPAPAIAPFDAAQAKQHQTAWAEHLGVPVEFENSIGMRFVLIPPGVLGVGARITKAFYLGATEVTQADYERVMGENPSKFRGDPSRPVEGVTWDDAAAFCVKLGQLSEEQATRATYRLPSEAQWEYACRAGTTTQWYRTDDEESLKELAWFVSNANKMTHPVGQKLSNAWGVYDMHGNVREWCADGFEPHKSQGVPAGPALDLERVIRGGCFHNTAEACKVSWRTESQPSYRCNGTGFRVVASLPDLSGQ